MREFFLSQMDYVFFVYGLAFILLFSVCTALHKKSKTPIPWEWLGAFGLIHGLHEWVELLALSPSHSDSFHGICVAMLGVSFFCLFEFGRLTCERLKYFRLGRWIYIPLCLTVFSAASFGLSGVNAAIRYSFGFSGGLLSALALWRSSRESKDRRGWAMVWAAAAMGVYAVAAGGVAPKTGVFLADMINHDTFFKWAGFPVQILRAFAACAFSVAIVVYHKDSLRESVPHPAGYGKHLMVAALLALLATLVAGWFWTDYEGQREATLQKAQLLSDAQQSVVAVDPQLVRDLSGSAADVQTVAYQALKSRLQNLREVMTSIRFIYLMREVDGKIVFLVDSETGGYKDESPPGQVYDEATTTMHEALASGRAMVEPPTTDRWGCWISAYVPLKDGHTGELLAVLGVDQSARNFEEAVAVARLKGIVPVGILCFGFLFMFAFWERFVFAVGPGKEGREPDLWVKWVMVAIVGVIGLTLTILLFLEFQESAESAFKTIFLQRAITRAESISKELDRQVDRLDGLRRFMHSRELVGRSEFNEYVAPLSKDVPIRAFEWIPRVARGDRVFYESSARQDNCEGFQIYEKDALGNKIPALDREEYFPVYYVDPLKGNEEALGYDLASEPVRRAAMEKSRDWGSAVATPPIELVQRGKKSTGILIFMPVYAKDLPHRTLEQRRNSLKGFVLVVYNADDFLKGVYERMPLEGLACLMEDLAAPAGRQVLLRQEVNGEEVDWRRPVMKYAMSLEIPDRQWRVTLVPSKVFSERLLSRVYGWVLPIGFFLTALVALFLNFLMMSRYRAERLVNLRTDELKQEKETLRASEESYRKQFANNVAMMLLIDPQEGTILDANAAALEFYGYPRERLLAMKITDINTLPAAEVRQALSSVVPGKGHLFQFQNRRAEGSVRDVEMAVSSIQFGSCIVLHAIIFDITERKRAAEALRENEEKFRHLIETTRTGFLVLDGQGRVVDANAEYVRLSGHQTLGEILGRSVTEWTAEHSRKKNSEALVRCCREGILQGLEIDYRGVEGRITPVEITATVEGAGDGFRILSLCRDITERKSEEKRFRESSEMVQLLLNSAAEAVYGLDKQGLCTFVNATCLKILGYERPEQLLGKNMHEMIHSKHPDGSTYDVTRCPIFKAFTEGREAHIDHEVLWKRDGTFFSAEYWSYPIRQEGQVIGAVVTFLDITERRRAEESFRQVTDRLSLATRAGGVGIWDYEVLPNKLIWDDSMYRLYGITADKFSGAYEAWQAGIHPEDRQRGHEEIQRALRGEKEFDTEFRVLWPDGTVHNIRGIAVVQRDAFGKPTHMIGTNWDITDFKRVEHDLKKQKGHLEAMVRTRTVELELSNQRLQITADDLRRASQAKSDFLANMSHELRTPLNSIIGFSEVLFDEKMGPLNERQKKYAENVHLSGQHLLSLINDVLDLSRVESGKMVLEAASFSIKNCLSEILQLVQGLASSKKLSPVVEFPEDLGELYADQRKFKQVVYNLLSNAIKFTPAGGRFGLRARRDDAGIEVTVWDTGIGIEPGNLDKAFEAFTRLGDPYTQETEGTGLGLTICRKIVELHGGKIGIESEGAGKGTTVKFTIPSQGV